MGWTFPWVSAYGTDFNYDFGVSFRPDAVADATARYNYGSADPGMEDREGISVFVKTDDGELFHTYSTYARGIDMVNGAYQFLDLVPKGRDEPVGNRQFWVRRHDEYDTTGEQSATTLADAVGDRAPDPVDGPSISDWNWSRASATDESGLSWGKSSRVLRWGKGSSGTDMPRASHSGPHPSLACQSTSRSDGTESRTSALWRS